MTIEADRPVVTVPNDPQMIARAIDGWERTDRKAPFQPDPGASCHAIVNGREYVVLVNHRAECPVLGMWTVRSNGRLMRLGPEDWPDDLAEVAECYVIRDPGGQYAAVTRNVFGELAPNDTLPPWFTVRPPESATGTLAATVTLPP